MIEEKKMKHIIVIPYYSRREIKVFLETAKTWKKLTKTNLNYEFLLSVRYDTKPDKTLEKEFSKIAHTRSIQCQTRGKGIRAPAKGFNIEGPTAMFWDTMEYVNNNYPKDGGFVLWFEYDMVPLIPSWLDKLDEKWRTGNYVMMGKLIDRNWVRKYFPKCLPGMVEHINGGACYKKDFCEKVFKKKCNLKLSWDIEIFSQIKSKYSYKATNLIEFRFCHPTIIHSPHKETVLLHGIKDLSALLYARKSNKIDVNTSLTQSHIYELPKVFFNIMIRFIKRQIKTCLKRLG